MGSLSGALAEAGLDARTFDLFESVPDDLPWNEAAGLVVLGGTISANDGDRFPFLVAELDWIRTAVRRQVPMLGICLGRNSWPRLWGRPSIATRSRKLVGTRSNSCRRRRKIRCFETVRAGRPSFIGTAIRSICRPMPIHLARSPLCPHQAFRYGSTAYGLQFHVEMVPDLLELWLQEFDAGGHSCADSGIDPADIRSAAEATFPAMNSFSQCLLARFAAMCKV